MTPLPLARKEHLLIQDLQDEVLVYDQRTDNVHCLSRVSAFIWRHCDGHTEVGQIAARIEGELEFRADEAFVWEGLDRLEEAGLLQQPIARPEGVAREGLLRREVLVSLLAITTVLAPTPTQAQTPTVTSAVTTTATTTTATTTAATTSVSTITIAVVSITTALTLTTMTTAAGGVVLPAGRTDSDEVNSLIEGVKTSGGATRFARLSKLIDTLFPL